MQRTAQQDAEENAILEQARKIQADRRAEDAARQQEEAARTGRSAASAGRTMLLSQSTVCVSHRAERLTTDPVEDDFKGRGLWMGPGPSPAVATLLYRGHCFSATGGCGDYGCMPSQVSWTLSTQVLGWHSRTGRQLTCQRRDIAAIDHVAAR